MKQLKYLGILLVGVAICAGLAIGISKLAGHAEKASADNTATCTKKGQNHTVIINNSAVIPVNTSAKLCDTLTIKNTDSQVRLMAFGEHDHHEPYDGVTERVLDQNQSFTVTLNQAGTFKFHDHLDDSAQGTFIVK